MGFEPTIKSESFGGTDKSWIRFPRVGTDRMFSIMLDMSLFLPEHIISGKIPSGTVLAALVAPPVGLQEGEEPRGQSRPVLFYGPYTPGQGTQEGGPAGAPGDPDLTIPVGHLFEDVRVPFVPGEARNLATVGDVAAALYWSGVVLVPKLPTFTGAADGIGEWDPGVAIAIPTIKYVLE